jgi:hypothetical protein
MESAHIGHHARVMRYRDVRGVLSIMIERFRDREPDESEQEVLSHVERHGWNVTNIREEDGTPGWAFTIGLFETFGHPEVAILGIVTQ